MDPSTQAANKSHHSKQAGAKADKRNLAERKKKEERGENVEKRKDPRAFGVAKFGRVHKTMQRNLDMHHRKERAPITDRTPDEPPPVVVVIMGPPKSGKTTLIKSLVKRYTKHGLTDVKGPITVVTGKSRRVTFFECPSNDMGAMIDLAKIADLVLLTVDGSFGFEMETFEFLNVLQVHGFPRVMGVLTHLDSVRDGKKLRRVKKTLKARFWVEIHQGAKLFYLSGLQNGSYLKREIHNLSLYISRIKFRPLIWRSTHSYSLIDRVEDMTDPALVAGNPNVDRTVALFGFLRGTPLKPSGSTKVHIAGVGDFPIADVVQLPDPVPLPERNPEKRKARRTLNAKETLLYAPMSNVGAIVYDKDAVYINVPQVHFTRPELLLAGDRKDDDGEVVPPEAVGRYDDNDDDEEEEDEDENEYSGSDADDAEAGATRASSKRSAVLRSADGVAIMRSLQSTQSGMDDAMGKVGLSLFRGSKSIKDRDARVALGDHDEEELDEESEDEDEKRQKKSGSTRRKPQERKEADGTGRVRRRAVFGDEQDDNSESDDDDDDEEESDEDGLLNSGDDEDDDDDEEEEHDYFDDEDEDSDDDDDEDSHRVGAGGAGVAKWKAGIVDRAESALAARRKTGPNLMEVVYGGRQNDDDDDDDDQAGGFHGGDSDGDASSDGSELFLVRRPGENKSEAVQSSSKSSNGMMKLKKSSSSSSAVFDPTKLALDENAEDSTLWSSVGAAEAVSKQTAADRWKNTSLQRVARNRFVTGDWGGKRITSESKGPKNRFGDGEEGEEDDEEEDDDDGGGDDSDVFGDFEDLEGGGGGKQGRNSAVASSSDDDDDDDDENDDDLASSSSSKPLVVPGAARQFTSDVRDYAAERAKAAEEKARMKAEFDAEYDQKKSKGRAGKGKKGDDPLDNDDAEEDAATNLRRIADEMLEDSEEIKAARAKVIVQAEINKQEFANIPDAVRARMTGYGPGAYVRIELQNVPAEFITRFRATLPVLLGGLLPQEDGLGMIRMRLKKHRWHPRILKANDPLVFSIGWRRFQSLPVFSTQDDNERHRYLKYTPDHMHCFATLYGPITPPNTGVVAFQSVTNATTAFRIAATGIVLELDASMRVMKKLKLTGVPLKIFKNTAFVRGMFNSELEVAKFEGASIRTVSGVRGTVKKSVRDGPPGTFRATFEDRILMSDIVFCRTWVPVEPKRFYNPITSLLDDMSTKKAAVTTSSTSTTSGTRQTVPEGEFSGFGEPEEDEEQQQDNDDDNDSENDGGARKARVLTKSKPTPTSGQLDAPDTEGVLLMRPTRELRHVIGVPVKPNPDSLYTDIERPEVRKFNPMHIPRKLAGQLPFASKPKQQKAKSKQDDYFTKRAVIMNKEEKNAHRLMQQVFTVASEKTGKAKVKRREEKAAYETRKAADEQARLDKSKEVRKRRYRKEGLNEMNKRAKSDH